MTGSSNNAESYAIGGVSGMTTYDKREAQGATYGSSIKLGDSKVKHHHYLEYPHYHKPGMLDLLMGHFYALQKEDIRLI